MLSPTSKYLRSINLWFIVIFFATLVPGVWHLTDAPRTWFDEGLYIHIAENLALKGVYGMQIAPGNFSEMAFISVGYPLLAPVAFSIKMLGGSIFAGRVVMVIFLLITTMLAYAFAKRIMSPGLAKLSALLVTTFPPLYGHGKNVLGEVPGFCFLLGGCLALSHALEKRTASWLIAAGVLFGLAMATKPMLLVLAPVLGVAAIVSVYKKYLSVREVALVGAPALLMLTLWVITQFSSIVSNPRTVLDHYSNIGNAASVTPLILKNINAFFKFPSLYYTAALVFITVTAWMRQGKKQTLIPTVLMVLGTLLFIYFFRTPGWFRYLFFTQAIFLLLLPISLQAWGNKKFAALVSGLFILVNLSQLPRSILQFDDPAWRTAQRTISQVTAPEAVLVNVGEAALWLPHDNYYQIIRIRQGLSYGEEHIPRLATSPLVIARDSDDAWIEGEVGTYTTKIHQGNYLIWYR